MRYLMSTLVLIVCATAIDASEAACPKCVVIRKANAEKAKDQTWVFYEDWLETDEGKKTKAEEIQFEGDSQSPSQDKE